MKKIITMITVLIMCLSLCACGANEKSNETTQQVTQEETKPELTESEKAAVEMAKDAIEYLKEQLVLPESFNLKAVSYATTSFEELIFKISFSAKNKYGGVIDEADYFVYDIKEKAFAKLYQLNIELAESKAMQSSINAVLGKGSGSKVDDTTIYDIDAYFVEESKDTKDSYDNYKESGKVKEIDISYFE